MSADLLAALRAAEDALLDSPQTAPVRLASRKLRLAIAILAAPSHPPATAFERALELRIAQGWQLGGNACPILYTDEINGQQVGRDDLWIATTAGLKGSNATPAVAVQAEPEARAAHAQCVSEGYLWAYEDFCAGYVMACEHASREAHPDDLAVDRFAAAMKAKMAKQRAKGYGGWDNPAVCTVESLSQMLIDHVPKGDPVDVANFAMMLHQRGSGIVAPLYTDERTLKALGPDATPFPMSCYFQDQSALDAFLALRGNSRRPWQEIINMPDGFLAYQGSLSTFYPTFTDLAASTAHWHPPVSRVAAVYTDAALEAVLNDVYAEGRKDEREAHKELLEVAQDALREFISEGHEHYRIVERLRIVIPNEGTSTP